MSEKEEESDPQISSLPQYHPHLQRHSVKEVMTPFVHKPGCYLIRKSESQKGVYTVSVMHTDLHVYHFKILQQGRTYGIIPDKVFPSVAAMLDYYSDHDVPGWNVRHVRLRHPICRHSEQEARLISFKQESQRNSDFSAEENPSQRYMSVPWAGSTNADGREHVKISPLQLQQVQQGRPPKPPPDYVSEDHYAVPRDVDRSQLSAWMSPDEDVEGACSCGIPHQVSHLTHGWEVHRVHRKEDASNFGKLFFHNERTKETLWTLPSIVSSQLTDESRRALDHLEGERGESLQDKK
ncbi:GRB2-related adapter protein 2-like isoform X1 [Branchiostoma lanceolatum]|uniref:GRB2-related adapter protein 2-like isoform X1 n=2 Tax=Branchiostoma lanceolatum TaxID=7740 RepID=UPI0034554910